MKNRFYSVGSRSVVAGSVLSLCFAIALFSWIFGWELLPIHSFGWLTSEDASPSFFGFNFFLREPWSWPPALVSGFNAPIGTSLVFSDSFPLVSLALKAFHTFVFPLPAPFQFVGIWIGFCFLAQALASFHVLHRETRDAVISVLGSVFFILSPALVFRSIEATRHYSLMAHFFVILALGEWIAWARRREYRHWAWMILLTATLGIHFYFFVMVSFLYLFPTIESWIENKQNRRSWMLRQGLTAGMIVIFAWVFGYGAVSVPESKGGGFGLFAMDSLAWFISEGWALSQPFKSLNYRIQREGFQYLGLGVILGIGWMAVLHRVSFARIRNWISRFPVPASVFLFLFLLALSYRLWIFGIRYSIFLTIPLWFGVFFVWIRTILPGSRSRAFGITALVLVFYSAVGPYVRSSGRMGWVLTYLLVFGLILFVHGHFRRPRIVLLALLLVQLIDLYPLHDRVRHLYSGFRNGADSATVSPELAEFMGGRVKKVLVLAGNENYQNPELVFFAFSEGASVGPTYLARHDHGARARLLEEWRNKITDRTLDEGDLVFVVAEPENERFLQEVERDPRYRKLRWGSGLLVAI